ncbi:MAG: DNA recombination protein RmuC [Thermodesulfobacteriota bacterium]
MDDMILFAVIALLGLIAVLQIVLLVRLTPVDLNPLLQALQSIERSGERTERSVREEIAENRGETARALWQSREELAGALKGVGDTLYGQFGLLTQTTDKRIDMFRQALDQRLAAFQADNARQLDQMRETVDEKLQGTLDKRLGESFKLVSERLEQVSRGLGEMQALATGVGDLKKVLTNVKTRGTWGEVQLGAMLEQVLTSDQYAANVAVKEGGDRVEFAIRLPGRGEDEKEMVWLPVDAKFPVEDYRRLTDAEERADLESAEAAAKQLEVRIRQCAGDICGKYLNPPKTTDFGILFLPTEGLFAEVMRRAGLVEWVQRECRVVIAGPTTLWALLNSLQMGFRTLAIEKRSGEVWNLLSAVKTEWTKYGDILTRVQKKIHEASDTIEQAQTRARAIGRKLRDVQALPAAEREAGWPAGEES